METMLDVKRIARMLGVHPETIYRLVRSGKIGHSRVGRAIRISEAVAREALRDRKGTTR